MKKPRSQPQKPDRPPPSLARRDDGDDFEFDPSDQAAFDDEREEYAE